MGAIIPFRWEQDEFATYYQLYEDGVLIADNLEQPSFDLDMEGKPFKSYSYQVRGVGPYGPGELSDPDVVDYVLPGKIMGLHHLAPIVNL